MGTTRTALQAGGGVAITMVVAIEGISYLVTDGDASAVQTAWAATDWTTALGGLQIMGAMKSRLEPWNPSVQVGNLSFGVANTTGTSDTFGTLVGGKGAGVESFLNAAIDCNDTTVTVLSTSSFASSGHAYIGIECFAYTGKTATTFTTCTRGKFSPFKANTDSANRFGRMHSLPAIGDGLVLKPRVTSLPRDWKGRMVGIWAHRNVGGVLDTKAQAQLLWMGRIVSTGESDRGMVIVNCEDILSRIRDCVLMRDQYSARVVEGMYLNQGLQFNALDSIAGTTLTADPLIVIASGASGNYEMNAGYYTVDELADSLSAWFIQAKADAGLGMVWTWQPRVYKSDGSLRARFRWSGASGSSANNAVFTFPSPDVASFMGYAGAEWEVEAWEDSATHAVYSPETPYRIYFISQGAPGQFVFDIEDARGTFFDNLPFLPSSAGIPTDYPGFYTGAFAILQLGDNGPMGIFEAGDSATAPTQFSPLALSNELLNDISERPWVDSDQWTKVRLDDTGERRFRQVGVIAGGLTTVLARLLSSTGTSGYNHATLDEYPEQLGAGIPYEILGSTFLTSIQAVEEAHAPLYIVVEKPTRLSEQIGADLVIRLCQFVMKDGAIKLASWGTPTAAQATHVLTMANKASPADARDDQITVPGETDEFLVNVVKIEWNRVLSGGYRSTQMIKNPSSIQDLGHEKALTISLRNTYAGIASTSANIDSLIDGLRTVLPMFGKPLQTLHRTVDLTLFDGLAPGDFGTITDDHVRDPSTGARGLSSKACLLIGHSADWGGYEIDSESVGQALGEVEEVILPLNNISIYSPCAEVDISQANGGYNAGTKVLTCLAHKHSESTEAADATNFATGDKVRVIEIDPDDPASPETWQDTVAGQSGNTITLTTGLAGWTSTKYHRVISDAYTTAVTTQKSDVYQADDADGFVQDVVGAYAWGLAANQAGDFTEIVANDNVALYAQLAYGDGKPLDVGYEYDAARLVNNLVSYRTAPQLHSMSRQVKANTTACIKRVMEILPIMLGPGDLGIADRDISLKAWFRSAAGSNATIYVTLCRFPPSGTSFTTTDADAPLYQLNGPMSETLSFSTTSTTWAARTLGSVSIRPIDPLTGIGWLVVEMDQYGESRGLCQARCLSVAFP